MTDRLRTMASRCWCAEKSQGEPVGKPFFRCETCDDQLRAADLIEAQQTEIERLRAEVRDLHNTHRAIYALTWEISRQNPSQLREWIDVLMMVTADEEARRGRDV